MFNPHSHAVAIENTLHRHGLCSMGNAGEIERAPIEFLDHALKRYEETSEENSLRAEPFWHKYGGMQDVSMNDLGEEGAAALVSAVRRIFE